MELNLGTDVFQLVLLLVSIKKPELISAKCATIAAKLV